MRSIAPVYCWGRDICRASTLATMGASSESTPAGRVAMEVDRMGKSADLFAIL